MFRNITSSWRTTVFGILYACFVIVGEVYTEFDDKPDTKINWTHIGEALTVLGIGFSARDNHTTSAQANKK
jgi:hypothetical protein